jgi:hypothetical protein
MHGQNSVIWPCIQSRNWHLYLVGMHHVQQLHALSSLLPSVCYRSNCLTAIVSVIAGATSTVPYLQYLFHTLAASIALLFLFALLFYSVMMHMSGRREAKGLKWYHFWRKGDTHFPGIEQYCRYT